MRTSRLTVESGLYALAFLLAIGLRLLNLGSTPLSDYEASWALQALELARGGQPAIGANPLYVVVTGGLFFLLGDGNTIARLLPAVAGSALILVPLLFKRVFPFTLHFRIAGIILAFGLALDPGMVTISRLAGGPMPALVFGLLAIGMAYERKPILAGIFAGLALLSGPELLMGILGLVLTWLLITWLGRFEVLEPMMDISADQDFEPGLSNLAKSSVRIAAAVILLGGTLFLLVPQGLAGFASTFSSYMGGWFLSSHVPAFRLPVSLLVYQPLIVLFAIVGLIRGWMRLSGDDRESGLVQRLSLWAIVTLVIAMVYPGRQVQDVQWLLVPLWGIASIEFSHYIPLRQTRQIKLVALTQALMVFTLLLLAGMNFMGLARFRMNEGYYWLIILGSLVMILVATVLTASGWSIQAAKIGLVWGVCAALGALLLSSTWGLSQLRQNSPEELYSIPPATGQAKLLLETVSELSQWKVGLRQELDLSVTYDTPSLRWALREFPHVSFIPELTVTDIPSIIITPQNEASPTLTQSYRGQDFNWRIYPAWEGVLPPDRIAWLAYHQAPLVQEQIILWGRADIFPGGNLEQDGIDYSEQD